MTYLFPREGDGEPEPDLIVNLYQDARVAEVAYWSQRYGAFKSRPCGFTPIAGGETASWASGLEFLTDSHHGPVQSRLAAQPPFHCKELLAAAGGDVEAT